MTHCPSRNGRSVLSHSKNKLSLVLMEVGVSPVVGTGKS